MILCARRYPPERGSCLLICYLLWIKKMGKVLISRAAIRSGSPP
jgi:hypothetical protein